MRQGGGDGWGEGEPTIPSAVGTPSCPGGRRAYWLPEDGSGSLRLCRAHGVPFALWVERACSWTRLVTVPPLALMAPSRGPASEVPGPRLSTMRTSASFSVVDVLGVTRVKTATTFGLTIPQSLLLRADQVIE